MHRLAPTSPRNGNTHAQDPALLLSGLAAALALAAAPAMAQSKGDWTFGVGLHNVAPKSDNGSLDATALGLGKLPPTEVSNSVRPTFTGEYFLADNLGVEVLAALPFEHDIAIRGVGRVGKGAAGLSGGKRVRVGSGEAVQRQGRSSATVGEQPVPRGSPQRKAAQLAAVAA